MSNIVLGSGELFWAQEDSNGNLGGERYIAETEGFSISISTETQDFWGNDKPIEQRIASADTRVDRNGSFTAYDIADENLALFMIADVMSVDQSSDTVTGETFSAVQGGLYYQLGTDTNPTGVRDVSNVVVEDGSATSMTEGTDYEVDLKLGRIKVIEGGALDGGDMSVDYDTASIAYSQVATDALGTKKGALRFIGNNTEGENRDLYIPRCRLTPDGEMAFKSRDTWQQMSFGFSVLQRGSMAQVYIDGRPS